MICSEDLGNPQSRGLSGTLCHDCDHQEKVGGKAIGGELENDVSLPATPIEHMTVDMAFAFSQLGLWIFREHLKVREHILPVVFNSHQLICFTPFSPKRGARKDEQFGLLLVVSVTTGCVVQAKSPFPSLRPGLAYVDEHPFQQ